MALNTHSFNPSSVHCCGGPHLYCIDCGECAEQDCTACNGEHDADSLKGLILQCQDSSCVQCHPPKPVRTQKAKCVVALRIHLHGQTLPVIVFDDLSNNEANKVKYKHFVNYYSDDNKSLFARPCPMLPRHGFVDSKPIHNFNELVEVFEATKAVDEQGEVLLMPFMKSAYNMVYANGSVTVGPGHDGATNGKNAITIPTSSDLPFVLTGTRREKILLEQSAITDAPYIEAIAPVNMQAYGAMLFTQLRNGPKVECTGNDFIPKAITVKTIIRPDKDMDLLQWERDCVRYAEQDGLVVVHEGGAISSHFGVHCVINGIPYLTTFTPKIGQKLTPTKRRKGKPDYKAFFQGFAKGLNMTITENSYTSLMAFVLSTLHNIPFATTDETQYIGAAIAILIRLGMAACYGEVRHYRAQKRVIKSDNRNHVYKTVFDNFSKFIVDMPLVYEIFEEGEWSSSYGGHKWADCTEQTIKLWNNVCRLYRKRTYANFKRLLGQFNTVINCAHNGGWWLNKYCHKEVFDKASVCASWAVMTGAGFYHHIYFIKEGKVCNELFTPLTARSNVSSDYIVRIEKIDNRRDRD